LDSLASVCGVIDSAAAEPCAADWMPMDCAESAVWQSSVLSPVLWQIRHLSAVEVSIHRRLQGVLTFPPSTTALRPSWYWLHCPWWRADCLSVPFREDGWQCCLYEVSFVASWSRAHCEALALHTSRQCAVTPMTDWSLADDVHMSVVSEWLWDCVSLSSAASSFDNVSVVRPTTISVHACPQTTLVPRKLQFPEHGIKQTLLFHINVLPLVNW